MVQNLENIFDSTQLKSSLKKILTNFPSGLSEHELFKILEQNVDQQFGKVAFKDPLNLFRTHFLLFHTLYDLRDELINLHENDLEISCLKICLIPYQDLDTTDISNVDPLRKYYGDLQNLQNTTREDVVAMLAGFWRSFKATNQRNEAFDILELPMDADKETIKQKYRQLAFKHHPDRGGDEQLLRKINSAMQCLRDAEL